MKDKLNISLIITLATILLSIGGSWGVMQLRAAQVDKIQGQADATDRKVVAIETKLDDIKDDMKDNKESLKEILKEIKRR